MKELIFDIETLSLDPLEEGAQVVCIAVQCGDFATVLLNKNEKELLKQFWRLIPFKEPFRLIGFNNSGFDIPYLLVRSFKYGLKIPDIKGRAIDLRFVLSYGNKFKKGKLEDYTTLFLYENGKKNGCNGEDVKSLWETGKHKELMDYCKHDVYLTASIYHRLKEMGVV